MTDPTNPPDEDGDYSPAGEADQEQTTAAPVEGDPAPLPPPLLDEPRNASAGDADSGPGRTVEAPSGGALPAAQQLQRIPRAARPPQQQNTDELTQAPARPGAAQESPASAGGSQQEGSALAARPPAPQKLQPHPQGDPGASAAAQPPVTATPQQFPQFHAGQGSRPPTAPQSQAWPQPANAASAGLPYGQMPMTPPPPVNRGGAPQWAPQGPPAPSPRPSRKKLYIIAGAIAAVVLLALATVGVLVAGSSGDKQEDPVAGKLIYELTGSGPASSLVYYTEDRKKETRDQVTLPWKSKPADATKSEQKGIAAINNGAGELTCKIYVDGKVVAESTSEGVGSPVLCSVPIGS